MDKGEAERIYSAFEDDLKVAVEALHAAQADLACCT